VTQVEQFDIVVVGGGIHGVGVAQAAAAAGYTVLVLEQRALAASTSSRSSKLIHGGLRYLESGQFALVRESLRERAILLEIAPDLVALGRFLLPVYATTSRRPWKLRLGLGLYALLAGLGPAARFGTLPRSRWASLDGLRTEGLEAVFVYRDALTDDAALTRAVMRSASDLGATLACPAQFVGAEIDAVACRVRYRQNGREMFCRAQALVNAAGPWVNEVLELVVPGQPRRPIDLVQGTHLVLDGTLSAGCYYLEVPRDGRAVFLMPWQGAVLLGTTETPYRGRPSDVRPLASEEAYLLDTVRHYFPRRAVSVQRRFAGLRVLPAAEGNFFGRSRETLISADSKHRPRLISIYGGKLTVYRAAAHKVMELLSMSLPPRRPRADTARLRLLPD
jgi:glycerol-3-phosphate dehydrogenase